MRNGKGDKRRPTDEEAYRVNYGNIFGPPSPIELKPFPTDPIDHAGPQKKFNLDFGSDALMQAALKVGNMLS